MLLRGRGVKHHAGLVLFRCLLSKVRACSPRCQLHLERNLEGLGLGQLGVPQDGLGNDKSVRRVKLKFGGVTRTIQANATSKADSHVKQQGCKAIQVLPTESLSF